MSDLIEYYIVSFKRFNNHQESLKSKCNLTEEDIINFIKNKELVKNNVQFIFKYNNLTGELNGFHFLDDSTYGLVNHKFDKIIYFSRSSLCLYHYPFVKIDVKLRHFKENDIIYHKIPTQIYNGCKYLVAYSDGYKCLNNNSVDYKYLVGYFVRINNFNDDYILNSDYKYMQDTFYEKKFNRKLNNQFIKYTKKQQEIINFMKDHNFDTLSTFGAPQYYISIVSKRDNNPNHKTSYDKLFYVEDYLNNHLEDAKKEYLEAIKVVKDHQKNKLKSKKIKQERQFRENHKCNCRYCAIKRKNIHECNCKYCAIKNKNNIIDLIDKNEKNSETDTTIKSDTNINSNQIMNNSTKSMDKINDISINKLVILLLINSLILNIIFTFKTFFK